MVIKSSKKGLIYLSSTIKSMIKLFNYHFFTTALFENLNNLSAALLLN